MPRRFATQPGVAAGRGAARDSRRAPDRTRRRGREGEPNRVHRPAAEHHTFPKICDPTRGRLVVTSRAGMLTRRRIVRRLGAARGARFRAAAIAQPTPEAPPPEVAARRPRRPTRRRRRARASSAASISSRRRRGGRRSPSSSRRASSSRPGRHHQRRVVPPPAPALRRGARMSEVLLRDFDARSPPRSRGAAEVVDLLRRGRDHRGRGRGAGRGSSPSTPRTRRLPARSRRSASRRRATSCASTRRASCPSRSGVDIAGGQTVRVRAARRPRPRRAASRSPRSRRRLGDRRRRQPRGQDAVDRPARGRRRTLLLRGEGSSAPSRSPSRCAPRAHAAQARRRAARGRAARRADAGRRDARHRRRDRGPRRLGGPPPRRRRTDRAGRARVPARRAQVPLERGKREALFVSPAARSAARRSGARRRRPRTGSLEIDGGVPLASSLGGDVVDGCTGACAPRPRRRLAIVLRGGYELGSGFGFGLTAGYVHLRQTTSSRPTVLVPVGASSPDAFITAPPTTPSPSATAPSSAPGSARRSATASPSTSASAPGSSRASATDTRSGHFKTPSGDAYDLVPAATAEGVAFFHLGPEVRVGAKLTKNVEINAGSRRWSSSRSRRRSGTRRASSAPAANGVGTFPADRILSSPVVAIEPGLGVRYQFSR